MIERRCLQALPRKPLPLRLTDDLRYMADVKQELINRFHESPFYLQPSSANNDIQRYTDKYRAIEKEKWTPRKIFCTNLSFIDFNLCLMQNGNDSLQSCAGKERIGINLGINLLFQPRSGKL